MLFLSHGLTLRLREGQGPHCPHRTSLPLPRVALCPMHPESGPGGSLGWNRGRVRAHAQGLSGCAAGACTSPRAPWTA